MTELALHITKASGQQVPFDIKKFQRSLENSGAGQEIIDQVTQHILDEITDSTTTKQLYKKAYTYLKKISGAVAARYSLKKAIMDLGPSGYPFEKFVGELLKYQDYQVEVGRIIKGFCVNHEIDVIAIKNDKKIMVECKFHSDQSRKTDVKIPLYTHSRFQDIRKQWRKQKDPSIRFYQEWLVTNTRFTDDASTFGNCAGLKLISWDYPNQGSLKQRISLSGLHPVTCLTSLSGSEKNSLLEMDIVLCAQLCKNENVLQKLKINNSRQAKIMKEAREICQIT